MVTTAPFKSIKIIALMGQNSLLPPAKDRTLLAVNFLMKEKLFYLLVILEMLSNL